MALAPGPAMARARADDMGRALAMGQCGSLAVVEVIVARLESVAIGHIAVHKRLDVAVKADVILEAR